MKYRSDLNLGEGLCIFTSFDFQDSGLYLLYVTVLTLIRSVFVEVTLKTRQYVSFVCM